MEEVKTIEEALGEMTKPGVSDDHRWAMLALAMKFIAWQGGCDITQDMSD